MSETKPQTDFKTIRDYAPRTLRDRFKDSDRVILTRGLNVPDEEGVKRRYPSGKYTAAELPAIAYEQGLVIEESLIPSKEKDSEIKPVRDLSKEARKSEAERSRALPGQATASRSVAEVSSVELIEQEMTPLAIPEGNRQGKQKLKTNS